ncbi:blast:Protein argonaute-2 [Drosophila guanche]|uniref:Blast:Protein argonaute-2 n=2 Tax=Drosophila guanche TaxID=7266 RepID=A0A3B0JZ26_DROGU|nr:blast:Protein argonaute-2 [Drosophila guanche]
MGKENKYKPADGGKVAKKKSAQTVAATLTTNRPPIVGPAASVSETSDQDEGEWQVQGSQKKRNQRGEKQQQQKQRGQQQQQQGGQQIGQGDNQQLLPKPQNQRIQASVSETTEQDEGEWQTQSSQKKRNQGGQGGQQRGQGDDLQLPPKPQYQRTCGQGPCGQGRGTPVSTQSSKSLVRGTPALPVAGGAIRRGTLGKPGQVAVNYLDVNLDKMPAVAYHYDVKISPERPKKFYRHAFEVYRKKHMGGVIAAYDGRASCYTADKIVCKPQEEKVTVTDNHGRTLNFTLQVKETEELVVNLSSLRSYVKDKINEKPMRALQVLEVVLASPCHATGVRAGRSFFKRSDQGKAINLGDGYEALVGLYQSVVLGDRPFVNVDVCHKSFPFASTVVEYIERYHGERVENHTNIELKRLDIETFLKGIKIVYKSPPSFARPPTIFMVLGLTKLPANRLSFDKEGQQMTVEKYFASREYNLKYPNLPCLHVGSPTANIFLPMELCSIEEGQLLNRKDQEAQVSAMIKYTATSTNERRSKILDLLSFFKHNSNPTVARFGMRLQSDFITVNMRILDPPMVEYKGNSMVSVKNGSWRMDRLKFYAPKPREHKWAILYGPRMMYNAVEDFKQCVLTQSAIVNVCLDRKAEIRLYKDERDFDNYFRDFKRLQCDFVFVIIPNSGPLYDNVKQKAELQHGILTQCIKLFTVQRKLNPQCIGNILLKVNAKLNGINHKLKDNPRTLLPNVMFMGADVTHPSPDQRDIPSVVGVTASHDQFGASYNMQYRLQRSTLEDIEDMESITLEHLRVYYQYRKCYPEHIVYYRDGVSDGQFPKIKDEELRGIKAACCKKHIRPKICCIIAVKRHHTRFFPSGNPSQFNKFNNVEPGTVVDRTIVHPNEMQFFLVSHQAIQGTARPTRYSVIENTGKLDIDVIQQLTYNLCHLFPRCNRAVSYPAPVYLAHLVAARGRVYLTGSRKLLTPKEEYQKRLIVPQFMDKYPMFFV